MAYIYKITNLKNGKSYIGATSRSVNTRFQEHLKDFKRTRFDGMQLYQAMRKHGVDKFECTIIEECNENELDSKEKYWIQTLQTIEHGYNTTLGGAGRSTIKYKELKKVLLDTLSIKETAKEIGCDLGMVRRFAQRENLYDLMRDRESHYESMSNAVVGTNPDGEMQIFRSTNSAAEYCVKNGAKGKRESVQTHIADNCKGKRKSAYGYYWQYL